MPYYRYRAKKGPQETVEGRLEAPNQESAIDQINAMGYTPVRIEPAPASPEEAAIVGNKPLVVRRVRLRGLVVFFSQLARLLKAGVPILKALGIIAEQTDTPSLRLAITAIAEDIKTGQTFSGALAKFPVLFSGLALAIIKAGEDSGTLSVALERIAGYLRAQDETLSKIKLALIYPAFMAGVGILTVIFMLVVVIPKIQNLYVSTGNQLPLPTSILLGISAGIARYWPWIAVLVIAAVALVRRFCATQKETVSRLVLRIPVYGNFVRKVELGRLTASMALSLSNGLHLLRAMELAGPVLSNEVIAQELHRAYERVKQGESLGRYLKQSGQFPLFMSNLIIVGEESGRLDEMLAETAAYFQKDTEEMIKILTSQFEPLMILCIGLVLGYIVIAMLLPIFQINLVAT